MADKKKPVAKATKKPANTGTSTTKTSDNFIPYNTMSEREKQAFKQGSNAKENQFKDKLGIWRKKKQD